MMGGQEKRRDKFIVMTTKQAANSLGVSVFQLRWLIRNGKLPAKKVKTENNQHGYVYIIRKEDVESLKRKRQSRRSDFDENGK